MKNTFCTNGFLSSNDYCSGLPALMEQYAERFPGLSYLHLFSEKQKQKMTLITAYCIITATAVAWQFILLNPLKKKRLRQMKYTRNF